MSDWQKYIEKQLEDPEFCEEYYATRNEAKKAFHDLREQAADVPEMTLDEINDEIVVVRTELKESKKAIRLNPNKESMNVKALQHCKHWTF